MGQFPQRGRGKKLLDAARLLTTGRLATNAASAAELSGFAADLEAFGAPTETVRAAEAKARKAQVQDSGVFAVHWSNVTAVKWFAAMRTQWRTTGLSTLTGARLLRTGLDYGAARDTAHLCGLEPEAEDFDKLRVLEAEALAIHTEQLAEEARRR